MQIECSILEAIPVSGTYPEVNFNARGECTWVKFEVVTDNDYFVWVGVFGPGIFGPSEVVLFEDGRHAFVLSCGQGYVVDCLRMSLVQQTENNYLQQALLVIGKNAIAACDFSRVSLITPTAELWTTEHIARDGIKLTEASDAGIIGLAEQHNGWEDFRLDFETGNN